MSGSAEHVIAYLYESQEKGHVGPVAKTSGVE